MAARFYHLHIREVSAAAMWLGESRKLIYI
jgi:hypothetical protein